mgnify:CR=1 FL=1
MIASRVFTAGAPSAYQPYAQLFKHSSRNEENRSAEVRRSEHRFKTVSRGTSALELTGMYLQRVLKRCSDRRTGRGESIKFSMHGIVFVALSMLSGLAISSDFDHQHKTYAQVLENHVQWNEEGTASTVDYETLKAAPDTLNQYLGQLSGVEKSQFKTWSRDQQLAFLINAYNAFTLKLIVDHYPVDSIRDIGTFWQNPWKMRFFTLLGEEMHLDQVEHEIIREPGVYNEPRIHFAVNCASVGCPALRTEPFTAKQIEQQLEDSTERFLQDETRNRYRDGRLEVSSIFKWYREDFERGWQGIDSLNAFFLRYADSLGLSEAEREQLREGAVVYRFLDYDWTLNE